MYEIYTWCPRGPVPFIKSIYNLYAQLFPELLTLFWKGTLHDWVIIFFSLLISLFSLNWQVLLVGPKLAEKFFCPAMKTHNCHRRTCTVAWDVVVFITEPCSKLLPLKTDVTAATAGPLTIDPLQHGSCSSLSSAEASKEVDLFNWGSPQLCGWTTVCLDPSCQGKSWTFSVLILALELSLRRFWIRLKGSEFIYFCLWK